MAIPRAMLLRASELINYRQMQRAYALNERSSIRSRRLRLSRPTMARFIRPRDALLCRKCIFFRAYPFFPDFVCDIFAMTNFRIPSRQNVGKRPEGTTTNVDDKSYGRRWNSRTAIRQTAWRHCLACLPSTPCACKLSFSHCAVNSV